jgi:hypothetical protein
MKTVRVLVIAVVIAAAIIVLSVVRVEATPVQEVNGGDEMEYEYCGELSEDQCERLRTLVETWNEKFDGGVSIVTWVYKGLLHDNIRFENGNDGNPISFKDTEVWIPVHRLDGRVSGALLLDHVLSAYTEEEAVRWRNWYRMVLFYPFEGDLASLKGRRSRTHVVNLEWSGDFTTSVVMREDRGVYIYDSMSLGVVTESISNSCIDHKLLWLWGGLRGQIRFDLSRSGQRCSMEPAPVKYMQFGKADLKFKNEEEPIRYENGSCEVVYSYAYATPIASMKFDKESFTFDIQGIGSKAALDNIVCSREIAGLPTIP